MNSLIVFAAVLAIASAGVAPFARTSVLQGPSTSSQVVGPDGSAIVSGAPGGRIVATEDSGLAAVGYSAPAVAAYAAPYVASPYVAGSVVAPAASYASHVVSYSTPYGKSVVAPVAAYAAHSVPVVSAYAAPHAHAYVASPVTASGYPVYAAGSGIEGQYVHDYTERLYDDGSYKGEIY